LNGLGVLRKKRHIGDIPEVDRRGIEEGLLILSPEMLETGMQWGYHGVV
jgi:hypothetical protein